MGGQERSLNIISDRARTMSPFLAMEVFERAAALERAGQSIVHLEVGEPDLQTPQVVLEAGIKALRDGHTHYTHSLGRPELREAIAAWHKKQYGVEVSADCVVVTIGSSGAMLLTLAALLDPGMQVLMTDPHYACYPKFVSVFGGVPVPVPVREEDDFQFDPGAVQEKLQAQTRVLVLNSPANPTGTVTPPERIRELVKITHGRALIVSDEIYHGLVYQGKAHSILEYCPEAIVINGFSKLFAMTGWRLGYAIVPRFLVRPVQKLQQNLFISAPDFPQFAAIAALTQTHDEIERRRRCYDERRQLVLHRLKGMGLEILAEPTGAFYVFVNVRRYTTSSLDFAFQLLEKARVAITPGVDFGAHGEGFIRISYANSIANIEEGMNRLEAFLRAKGVKGVRP
ncbi:pyridoxal phosphate-dependent aminotransferase [Acidobacteria bacterium AH-259-A15]|nr:pyridoxal phosphate-dependent aminotransferase [Acidobacteria bacterium AH-259-A15]